MTRDESVSVRRWALVGWARRRPYRAGALGVALFAVLFAWFNARDMYFVYDEWAYWTTRRELLDAGGLRNAFDFVFLPHNGHLQALVWITWWPLDWMFGMHQYLPYLLPTLLAQAGAGWLLFLLLEDQVKPAVAVAVTALFLFAGSAASVVAFAFTLGETVPVLATFGVLLAIERLEGRNRWMVIAVSLCVLIAMSASGIGLVVAGVAVVALALRKRYLGSVIIAAVAAVPYLVWDAEFDPPGVSVGFDRLGEYASYVVEGLAATGSGLLGGGPSLLGLVLVAVAVFGVVGAIRSGDSRWWLYLASAAGAVMFYAAVALRGIDLDPRSYSADQGRYLYIAGSLLLPAIAWAANRVMTDRRAAMSLAVVAAVVLPLNLWQQADGVREVSAIGAANRVSIASAIALDDALDQAPDGVPVADFSIRISIDRLRRLDAQGKVPCDPDVDDARETAARIGIPYMMPSCPSG